MRLKAFCHSIYMCTCIVPYQSSIPTWADMSSTVHEILYPSELGADWSIQFFFEMDQSASSNEKLGQPMLERVSYMLTIDFTRCSNMELDSSES